MTSSHKGFFLEANQSMSLVCLLCFVFDSRLQSVAFLCWPMFFSAFYGKSRSFANLSGCCTGLAFVIRM